LANIENVVQAAITGALEVYCSSPGMPQLELFPPYAVQQGSGLRKFCADLVGRLNDAQVILLEIKELNCSSGVLPAYDAKQHEENILFERLGVPIGYAYNSISQLPYHARPRPNDWAITTLCAIKRSPPSLLPDGTPAVLKHSSLLSWLEDANGGDISAELGRIHGAFKGAHNLRNGALVLLYAVDEKVLTSLTASDLDEVVKCLSSGSWLQPKFEGRLKALLGGSADVFSAFTTQKSKLVPNNIANKKKRRGGSSGPK
jgi:hypothetical protein